MNIALNNFTYDASDYADLVFLSSMSSDDLNNLLFLSTSKFQTYLTTNVFTKTFAKFPTVCTVGKASSLCSPKELAYQQWLDLSILPSADPKTPQSYVELYPKDTKLSMLPELGIFLNKANLKPFTVTLGNVITFMQLNRLYNLEILGDILLDKKPTTYDDIFRND